MEPPLAKDLGFKHGSQASKIYSLLYSAYTMGNHRVPIRVMLEYCPTTNHRARICLIRDKLHDKNIRVRFGTWIVPPAEGKGSESSYWLEPVKEPSPIQPPAGLRF